MSPEEGEERRTKPKVETIPISLSMIEGLGLSVTQGNKKFLIHGPVSIYRLWLALKANHNETR